MRNYGRQYLVNLYVCSALFKPPYPLFCMQPPYIQSKSDFFFVSHPLLSLFLPENLNDYYIAFIYLTFVETYVIFYEYKILQYNYLAIEFESNAWLEKLLGELYEKYNRKYEKKIMKNIIDRNYMVVLNVRIILS